MNTYYVVLDREYDIVCIRVQADNSAKAIRKVLNKYNAWADTYVFTSPPEDSYIHDFNGWDGK